LGFRLVVRNGSSFGNPVLRRASIDPVREGCLSNTCCLSAKGQNRTEQNRTEPNRTSVSMDRHARASFVLRE
ncbi:hypothetical protein CLOM_g13467, partial [Closterium sp. NIES-68]